MVKSTVTESVRPAAAPPRREPARALLSLLFIALAAAAALYQLRPPPAVPADAPPAEFSSGRALRHLQEIAREPRPIGSAGHAAARDYILRELGAQGVTAELQTASAVIPSRWPPFRVAAVSNVVGRLKGSAAGKAVLLVAHYDSVAQSPGASDDGAGVAALLETARALRSGGPPKSDVIFLFTDGEEVGLAGARAFVEGHPWAKDVGVVLNFDARGGGGQAMMFETSEGNGRLIQEFAEAAPHPAANSVSYEVYRLLPNDTDLTVFKRAGFEALNFAFIGGIGRYHTPADSVSNLDERSLQHQGSYALSLARRFGDAQPAGGRAGNAVYFNLAGPLLIRYPASLALPLAGLLLVAFVVVVLLGLRRGRLTARGIVFGWLALLVCAVASAALVWLSWWAVRRLHPGYAATPWGEPYNAGLYAAAFVALAVAITAALYNWFRKRTGGENLAVGALAWWVLLALAVGVLVPGASYLLTWPPLFMLAALGVGFALGESRPALRTVVLLLCTLPAVLLVTPLVAQLFEALTLGYAAAVVVFVVLLVGLLAPHLELVSSLGRWALPAAALLAFVGLAAAGLATAGFDRGHPRQDSLFYALNADTGKAVWGSADAQPDAWTSQFFAKNFSRTTLDDFFRTGRPFLTGEAPAAPLAAPELTLLSDENGEGGVRTLRLRVTSPRGAPLVSLYTEPNSEVVEASVDGRPVPGPEAGNWAAAGLPWGLYYYGLPPSGVELVLRVKSPRPFKLQAVDRAYGLGQLPGVSFTPRPDDTMAVTSTYGDSSFVTKGFAF